MAERRPFIACYMMSNRPHGTLYIGVTSDLHQRVLQHRHGEVDGFTRRHRLHRLVWYEPHGMIIDAIRREKGLKHYPRDWKLNLIEAMNPAWEDLFPTLLGAPEQGPLSQLATNQYPRPM